jgi:hypothetical protein
MIVAHRHCQENVVCECGLNRGRLHDHTHGRVLPLPERMHDHVSRRPRDYPPGPPSNLDCLDHHRHHRLGAPVQTPERRTSSHSGGKSSPEKAWQCFGIADRFTMRIEPPSSASMSTSGNHTENPSSDSSRISNVVVSRCLRDFLGSKSHSKRSVFAGYFFSATTEGVMIGGGEAPRKKHWHHLAEFPSNTL